MILIYVITNNHFNEIKTLLSQEDVVLIHNDADPKEPEWLRTSQTLLPVCHCALMVDSVVTDNLSDEIDIAKAMNVKVFHTITNLQDGVLHKKDVMGYVAGMKDAYLEFMKRKEEEGKDIEAYVDAIKTPTPEPELEPIDAEGHIIKFPGTWYGSE